MNRKFLLASAIFLAVFVIYSPSLGNGFVNWDDPTYVYENKYLGLPAAALLKWAFTSFYFANWHPLTLVSLSVDYGISGLNPFTFHLTSVLLHCLNAVLVFFLTLSLIRAGGGGSPGKACWAGFVAALFFGLHPLHVESVSWVSERKDVLSAAFSLAALLCYLRYAEKGRRSWYVWTAVSTAAALLSKPMAVTLPFVMLILDYFPLDRTKDKKLTSLVLEKAPFIIMSAAVSAATMLAQGEKEAILMGLGVPERLLVAVKAYVFYLQKTILPSGLAPLYSYPAKVELISLEYLVAVFVFIALTAAAFRAGRLYRAVWLYYIVTLLPVIGIIQVGPQAAADRYTYLSLNGFFVLAGLGAVHLTGSVGQALRNAAVPLTAVVLAGLSVLTVGQQSVWKDSASLWDREIEVYPGASPLAHYNRGMAFQEKGDYSRAIEYFTTTVAMEPRFIKAYINRGFSFSATGEPGRAIKDFSKVLELDPGYVKAYLNRGFLYLQSGENGLALKDLSEAVRLEKNNGFALHNIGVVYSRQGDKDLSEVFFKRAAAAGYSSSQ
ncbi:hypothetical protein BAC1_00192 [uncultured bacterium]|nr:hypothetical protein BAC1_00192 [uncultured bacterium]